MRYNKNMTEFQKIVEELGGKTELVDVNKFITKSRDFWDRFENRPGKPMDRGIVVEFANGLRMEAGFRLVDKDGKFDGLFTAAPRTDEEIWKDAEWDLVEHYEVWYDRHGFNIENPVGEDYSSLSEFKLKACASGVFAV